MGLPPAHRVDAELQDGRPERTGEIIATGHNGHRNAAPAHEPMGDVGNQRTKGHGAAQHPDHQALHGKELPVALGERGHDIAGPQKERAQDHRTHNAPCVGQAAHEHTADGKAHKGHRIGQ